MQSNNFKSIDPNVTCCDEIDDYIGYALCYQDMFDRRTTPWEKIMWDDDELNNIKIDPKAIDRLYYIYHFDDQCTGQNFNMAGRMVYNGQPLYVELSASCDFTGFDCQGHGVIFVSTDANLFMKLVMTEKFQKDAICESLAHDGIIIEEQTEYDSCERMFWKNAPMLKYLCHQVVYENQTELKHYSQVLPKVLTDSIIDFIRTKDAKKSYDE